MQEPYTVWILVKIFHLGELISLITWTIWAGQSHNWDFQIDSIGFVPMKNECCNLHISVTKLLWVAAMTCGHVLNVRSNATLTQPTLRLEWQSKRSVCINPTPQHRAFWCTSNLILFSTRNIWSKKRGQKLADNQGYIGQHRQYQYMLLVKKDCLYCCSAAEIWTLK